MSKVKYGVKQISTLEGIEAIRKRPGMYIASTDINGVYHLLLEVLSNSIDEYLAGECNKISVIVGEDDSIKVQDNGRGIPFGVASDGSETLENLFTKLHTGAKFAADGSTGYNSSGGLHGIGIKAANALSDYLRVTSVREGKKAIMFFEKGVRTAYEVLDAKTGDIRGTTIEFLPDDSIFQEDGIELKAERIKQRLEEFSYLCTDLELTLRYKGNDLIQYKSKDGLLDYMADLTGDKVKLTETFRVRAEEGKYSVDIALCYTEGHQETNRLYTNNIPNSGGTHLTGYRSAMTRTVNELARAEGLLKKQEKNLTGEDLREGLVLILSLNMSDPVFSGQTKDVLTSAQGRTVVERILTPEIEQWFNSNPENLKTIVEKALTTRRARVAAQRAREATRGSSKTKLKSTLQGKLADCLTSDPAEAELFLVEGHSAGGSAKTARNRQTQAIMALQGKVLNAQRNDLTKLLKNQEIRNIIQAIGCGIGPEFDYDKLRYDKIILMMDSDSDGGHIQVLLLTFFFKHMPQLIENGNIYLAMAPLYRITKGSESEYLLDDSDLNDYREKNPNGKYEVSYFKGLGEMNPDELNQTTLNPASRRLKQITIQDVKVVKEVFEDLMGSSVIPRREFIEQNANMVNAHI